MCRTAAAARGRRRDCTCKLCQVAHPFPIQRWEQAIATTVPERAALGRNTHSHTGSIGSAVPEDVRKRERGERRRRRRRMTEGGGASTASQEAGVRVAMQMGSIHIANHWSLSALQRTSLFRQNSRNWSYVPQPWFLSRPPPTRPVQSFHIHSPVRTFMIIKKKRESKWESRNGWIYFRFYLCPPLLSLSSLS